MNKNVFILTMILMLLGLNNCKSTFAPEREEPKPNCEYRYNVEVTYTRTQSSDNKTVQLIYYQNDPCAKYGYEKEGIWMTEVSENKFRCCIEKVFVQTPIYPEKHSISANDVFGSTGENIVVQGAYDMEIQSGMCCGNTVLYFRMAK